METTDNRTWEAIVKDSGCIRSTEDIVREITMVTLLDLDTSGCFRMVLFSFLPFENAQKMNVVQEGKDADTWREGLAELLKDDGTIKGKIRAVLHIAWEDAFGPRNEGRIYAFCSCMLAYLWLIGERDLARDVMALSADDAHPNRYGEVSFDLLCKFVDVDPAEIKKAA